MLVLSLFPGIGLLDRAFEEAGFCVVRGPDLLWGGDVRAFHPPAGVFAGVIGGPPCQAFSRFRHLVLAHGYRLADNLIPEYERCVCEGRPTWFLMENVPAAPEPAVAGYSVTSFLLNNRWIGATQNRVRRISFGLCGARAMDLRYHLNWAALEPAEWRPAVNGSGTQGPDTRDKYPGHPVTQTLADALRLQGLPADFFGEECPLTDKGKRTMIGNGVPLPMGRALAAAVQRALTAQEAA